MDLTLRSFGSVPGWSIFGSSAILAGKDVILVKILFPPQMAAMYPSRYIIKLDWGMVDLVNESSFLQVENTCLHSLA